MNIKSLISLPVVALAALLCAPVAGSAQSILLSAGNFAVLAKTTVTNIGPTVISGGNLGLSPGVSVTGFPPGSVAAGGSIIIGGASGQAVLDLGKAASGLTLMAPTTVMASTHLGGLTLPPGVYEFTGSADLNGALTLDAQGQNDAYWVFQIATTLTTNITSSVTIINPGYNGGSDDGVFWDAGTGITINGGQILGNYLAGTAITLSGTVAGNGRALADAAVTLSDNLLNAQGGPSGSDYTGGLMYNPSGAVVSTPPIFTLQPANQSVIAGSNATYTAAASNGPTYQWQREPFGSIVFSNLTNDGTYSNVTTGTLTISNTTQAMSGDQFQLVGSNFGGNTTSTSASLTVTTPLPVFSGQPANQSVTAGSNATFSALANGNATYQWQREPFGTIIYSNLTNSGAYSNVTTANLTISNTTLAMSGDQFQLIATNLGGSTSSTSAMLTVTTPLPVFSGQPANQAVTLGGNATYSALANGNATYQWQREPFGTIVYSNLTNAGAYSNVTTANLTVSNTTLVMSGDLFRAVATNLGGSTTSTSASLTVNLPPVPVFSAQPGNQSLNVGGNTTFSALANGNATYQWQLQTGGIGSFANITNTGAFSGATTGTLMIANTTQAMSGDKFQVVASNLGGSTTSTSASLTVITPVPVFSLQPVNETPLQGTNTTFTALANGNATYQWQVQTGGIGSFSNVTNTGAFSGATTGTLAITNTTLAMSGDEFQVVATNLGGSTTSDTASLTVTSLLPVITLQPMNTTIRATQNVTFRVVATGPGPLTYVWRRNNIKISNGPRVKLATTATLVLTHMVFGNAGNYTVTVTNPNGSVISDDAKLTIIPWRP